MKKKIAVAVGLLILIPVIISFVYYLKQPMFEVTAGEVFEKFPDDSETVCIGGPDYDHRLFGDCRIRFSSNEYFYFQPKELFCENDKYFKDGKNYILLSYSFDKNGYITAHVLTEANDTDKVTGKRIIEGNETAISADETVVFNINNGTYSVFTAESDFRSYIAANNIKPGVKYRWAPFGSVQEKPVKLAGDYYLVSSYGESRTVRSGDTDLFYGKIDKYCVADRYIAFIIKINSDDYSPEFPDAVNKMLSKDKKETCYILISTDNNETSSFNSKSELNLRLKEISAEKPVNWVKTEQ